MGFINYNYLAVDWINDLPITVFSHHGVFTVILCSGAHRVRHRANSAKRRSGPRRSWRRQWYCSAGSS